MDDCIWLRWLDKWPCASHELAQSLPLSEMDEFSCSFPQLEKLGLQEYCMEFVTKVQDLDLVKPHSIDLYSLIQPVQIHMQSSPTL